MFPVHGISSVVLVSCVDYLSFALIPSFNRVKGTFETRGSKLELVFFSLLNYELIYLSNTVRRVVLKSGLCGKKA